MKKLHLVRQAFPNTSHIRISITNTKNITTTIAISSTKYIYKKDGCETMGFSSSHPYDC